MPAKQSEIPSTRELLDALPLCVDENFYSNLESVYPRPRILRWLRWGLAHFIVDVLSGVGIAAAIGQKMVSALSKSGLSAFSVSHITHSSTWKLVQSDPLLVVGAIALLAALFPVGYWMRKDERTEAIAIARREAGKKLAHGYNLYLQSLALDCGQLPPILTRQYQHRDHNEQPMMHFVPVSLARSDSDNLMQLPLEHPAVSKYILHNRQTDVRQRPFQRARNKTVMPIRLGGVVDSGVEAIALSYRGAIVVRGQPGTGKTMLLRQLALGEYQKQQGQHYPVGRIPFLLDLTIADLSSVPFQQIVRELVQRNSELDEEIIERIVVGIVQGPSIVLIDGLDEVKPGKRRQTLSAINALAKNARTEPQDWEAWHFDFQVDLPLTHSGPGNETLSAKAKRTILGTIDGAVHVRRAESKSIEGPGSVTTMQIVVGSRPATFQYRDLDPQLFEVWDLQPLTRVELQRRLIEFVLSVWYRGPSEYVSPNQLNREVQLNKVHLDPNHLLAQLNYSAPTRGWASSPLLLTLATVDWARENGTYVARTREALYRSAVTELMKQRTDSEKWSEEEQINLLRLAEAAALRMYELGKRSLNVAHFKSEVEPYLPDGLMTSDAWPSAQELGGSVLLAYSGLFIAEWEPANHRDGLFDDTLRYNIYHLTFLEYLAARALARDLARRWSKPMSIEDACASLRELGGVPPVNNPDATNEEALARFWRHRLTDHWAPVLPFLVGVLTDRAHQSLEPELHRPDLAIAIVRALINPKDDVGFLGTRRAAACIAHLAVDIQEAVSEAKKVADLLVGRLKSTDAAAEDALTADLKDACLAMAESDVGRQAIATALLPAESKPDGGILNTALAQLTLVRVKTEPDEARRQLYSTVIDQRVSAARAFEAMGPDAVFALPDLRNRLADTDARMRLAVVCALGALGPVAAPAIPRLLEMLDDPNAAVQAAAAETIRKVGGATAASYGALPLLVAYLSDAAAQTRNAIITTLGELGAKGAPILPSLLSQIHVPSAVRALGMLGTAASPAIPRLLELLNSNRPELRLAATESIGQLVGIGVAPLSNLVPLAQDVDSQVRAAALHSLGATTTHSNDVIGYLITALDDPSLRVRRAAASALSHMNANGFDILPLLTQTLEGGTQRARIAGITALADMGEKAHHAVEVVIPLLRDPNPSTQLATAEALLVIGETARPAVPALLEIVTGPNHQARVIAARAMRQCHISPKELNLDYSTDSREEIRFSALQSMESLGEQAISALPDILACLEDRSASQDVRWSALNALVGLQLRDEELHELLGPLAPNLPPQVRVGAERILSRADSSSSLSLPPYVIEQPAHNYQFTGFTRTERPVLTVDELYERVMELSEPAADLVHRWEMVDWPIKAAILTKLANLLKESTELATAMQPLLLDSLCDSSPLVRAIASSMLGEWPNLWPQEPVEQALFDTLSDEIAIVRFAASTALSKRKSTSLLHALPNLRDAARSGHPEGIYEAFAQRQELDVLFELGPIVSNGAERAATFLTRNHHWSVRQRAIQVIGDVVLRHSLSDYRHFLFATRDSDPAGAVREMADRVLARILSIDPTAPDAFVE